MLLCVTFATAFLLELTPGDPAATILGDAATPEAVEAVRLDLGLDMPWYERYVDWLSGLVRGDLGESFRSGESVGSIIRSALPVTIELVVLAVLMALLMAVPAAMYAAYRSGGRFDRAVHVVSSALVSVPPFVSAPLLVWLLVLKAGWFSATGWTGLWESPGSNLRFAFLPALALALNEAPLFAAALRSDMVTTLRENYIANARARGIRPRTILVRHALKPSSLSLLTLVGLSLGRLIGAAVVVEVVFVLPGLGTVLINSIHTRDFPTVQGVVVFIACVYVLANTVIDLLYRYLDPRV